MTLEEASRNPVVQQRLQAIIEQFPQHLSAKMLLVYGKGGQESKASLSGSVMEILNVMQPFMERYSNAMVEDSDDSKSGQEFSDKAVARLKHLRERVNDRAKDYLGLSQDVLGALVSYLHLNNKTSSTAMRRREDVEEFLYEFNDEFRRLRDLIDEERDGN